MSVGAVSVQVCNLALAHIGVGKTISSLTERSPEAEALNEFYEIARDAFLEEFAWPFAKRQLAIGLVSTAGDDDHPTTHYTYAYRYPSDCLFARRIIAEEERTESRNSRWSYDLLADDEGTLIVTDKESAVLEYTSILGRQESRWKSSFIIAFSQRLASLVAPRLMKGDTAKVGDRVISLERAARAKAMAICANEVQPDEEPDSDSVRVRN